ncbi:MAG: hypothetical protein AXA67_00265 [Methylothermaceae bacteria B42]|nr:MAG: hypothetical protein AXA67_00265 [Methylothermaceae bacteria B42]HHJ38850.1 ABC transporter permease subunit [Methylothermaceae bacterium]
MKGRLFKCFILIMALPAFVLPILVLGYILYQGVPSLMEIIGASNGRLLTGQMLGSLLLMVGACLIASPVALGLAIFLHSKPQDSPWLSKISGLLYLLQGIPPIVYGLCGLAALVHLLQWGVSLLAGMVILSVVILPMLTLNCHHALNRIPAEYTEAGRSLGLGQKDILIRVWIPVAWPGLVTAILLSLARTLSETAPILFTATVFAGVIWPGSWFSPVTTLQTQIFYLAQEGLNDQAIHSAWAAAMILVALISLFSLAALWLRHRYS